MRRATLAGVAAAALATAATALAASQQYNGPAGSGRNAGVEFGAKLSGGHPVSVRRFTFFNIPAQCTGSSPTAVTDGLSITMHVTAQRTFKGGAPVGLWVKAGVRLRQRPCKRPGFDAWAPRQKLRNP